MDNFDSGNNGRNGFGKAAKVILYIFLMAVVFIGGGATYKYVFEGQLQNGLNDGNLSPAAAQVSPDQEAYTPITPTPSQTASVPAQDKTKMNSPTPNNTSPFTSKPTIVPTPKQQTQRERILVEMHKMVNSKVEADFIWGEIPITEEAVDKLITEVSETKFPDRDKLLTMLENWKLSDFSNAVNDHNYIWGQLGGTIGKATALRAQQ